MHPRVPGTRDKTAKQTLPGPMESHSAQRVQEWDILKIQGAKAARASLGIKPEAVARRVEEAREGLWGHGAAWEKGARWRALSRGDHGLAAFCEPCLRMESGLEGPVLWAQGACTDAWTVVVTAEAVTFVLWLLEQITTPLVA